MALHAGTPLIVRQAEKLKQALKVRQKFVVLLMTQADHSPKWMVYQRATSCYNNLRTTFILAWGQLSRTCHRAMSCWSLNLTVKSLKDLLPPLWLTPLLVELATQKDWLGGSLPVVASLVGKVFPLLPIHLRYLRYSHTNQVWCMMVYGVHYTCSTVATSEPRVFSLNYK